MSKVTHTLKKATWLYALAAFLFIAPAFAQSPTAKTTVCDGGASRDSLSVFLKLNHIKVVKELKGKNAKALDETLRGKTNDQTDDVVLVMRGEDVFGFGFKDGCLVAQGTLPKELGDGLIHSR